MADTAKQFSYSKAPKEINLEGLKERPESAEHIITFPGGYFAVTRTSDNKYWVHVGVNEQILSDIEQTSRVGKITRARVDVPGGCEGLELPEGCTHLAFLVETFTSKELSNG